MEHSGDFTLTFQEKTSGFTAKSGWPALASLPTCVCEQA